MSQTLEEAKDLQVIRYTDERDFGDQLRSEVLGLRRFFTRSIYRRDQYKGRLKLLSKFIRRTVVRSDKKSVKKVEECKS